MATTKHFSDWNGQSVELTFVHGMPRKEFEARFPGVKGHRFDSYAMLAGAPISETPVYDNAAKKWVRTLLPVTRSITFKSAPSLHECDARCMNATGRTMQCECSCGGVNHGRGNFACEAA